MQQTDAEIAQRLRTILASEPFQVDQTHQIWDKILALFKWLSSWLDGLDLPIRVGIGAVCIITLLALGAHLVSVISASRRPHHGTGAAELLQLATGATPVTLLQRAHLLAEGGQLRDAARTLQQAVFMHLCHARQVPWRDSTADWEWLQLLRPGAEVVEFTRAAQRLAFGPEPTRAEFDACVRAAEALLPERSAA